MYYVQRKLRSISFTDANEAKHWAHVFDVLGPDAGKRALQEALGQVAPPPPEPTIEEMVLRHIELLTGIQAGTRADYVTHAHRDIVPLIGDVRRSEITKAVGAQWVNQLEDRGLSGKTIKNRHSLLSAAIETQAVETGHLTRNPVKGLRLPDASRSREDMQFLNKEQFATLVSCVRPQYRDLITVLVGTGMRWGEAAALRVANVRLDAPVPTVVVREAVKHRRDGIREVGGPKSKQGRREIPLSPTIAVALRRAVDGKKPNDLVFVSITGQPMRYGVFHRDTWSRAQAAAVKAGLTAEPAIHDLRHTCASWWLAAGVPILTVSKLLGHTDAGFTLRVYGHALPGDSNLVIQVTEQILSGIETAPKKAMTPVA
ncbi:tyrosine-type recombinase/integrase [Kineosporia succinea]|uniref:Integrase n=1 Tax=Kineosporia succinea TaxID=84632 RepID=A0ABT9NXM5_9ACTN|nr:site-specific integrase [Kineosporia succinea]MDP9825188.1 integrase [Kineosporia succinea]